MRSSFLNDLKKNCIKTNKQKNCQNKKKRKGNELNLICFFFLLPGILLILRNSDLFSSSYSEGFMEDFLRIYGGFLKDIFKKFLMDF